LYIYIQERIEKTLGFLSRIATRRWHVERRSEEEGGGGGVDGEVEEESRRVGNNLLSHMQRSRAF
jgi:hypothetical protein